MSYAPTPSSTPDGWGGHWHIAWHNWSWLDWLQGGRLGGWNPLDSRGRQGPLALLSVGMKDPRLVLSGYGESMSPAIRMAPDAQTLTADCRPILDGVVHGQHPPELSDVLRGASLGRSTGGLNTGVLRLPG